MKNLISPYMAQSPVTAERKLYERLEYLLYQKGFHYSGSAEDEETAYNEAIHDVMEYLADTMYIYTVEKKIESQM